MGGHNWSFDHSLPTQGAAGVRTARRNFMLLASQSQAPGSQAAPLQADGEIHARCEAMIVSEGRLGL
jgi:hypothetical protein